MKTMTDPKIIKDVKRRLAAKKAELKACKDPSKISLLKAEIIALEWAAAGCPLKVRK